MADHTNHYGKHHTPVPLKKCGHPKNYKCCCNVNDVGVENNFDLITELNLGKSRTKQKDAQREYWATKY